MLLPPPVPGLGVVFVAACLAGALCLVCFFGVDSVVACSCFCCGCSQLLSLVLLGVGTVSRARDVVGVVDVIVVGLCFVVLWCML